MKKKDEKNTYFLFLKKFWRYLWYDDSIGSYVLNFIVAFVLIKYVLFPGLGLILNNEYPVVAIVSGSMEHKIVNNKICDKYVVDEEKKKLDIESWWDFCGKYYEQNYNISLEIFSEYEYENGLNIGDVMILYGKDPSEIEIGEVLVFIPQDKTFFETKGPVIHRVVDKWKDENNKYHFRTKGDHNPKSFENFENDITEENVIGVGVVRIPFIGYAKLILSQSLSNIMGMVS